jgi:O-antigen/teichoic acid export membrane protein
MKFSSLLSAQQLKFLFSTMAVMSLAASGFLSTILFQRYHSAADFGIFAFSNVLNATATSFANAFFISPLAVSVVGEINKNFIYRSFTLANSVYTILAVCVSMLIMKNMGASANIAWLSGATLGFAQIRWFQRNLAISLERVSFMVMSDYLCAFSLLVWIGFLVLTKKTELENFYIGVLISNILPILLLCLANKSIFQTTNGRLMVSLKPFLKSFSMHGKWATLGVATTEMVTNAHTYIVALFLGPYAFAPIALAQMFLRPTSILNTVITQLERPKLATSFKAGKIEVFRKQIQLFRNFSLSMLALNLLLVIIAFYYFGEKISKNEFSITTLFGAVIIYFLIFVVKAQYAALSLGMQAAGKFKDLSFATLVAAPVSVFLVLAIAYFFRLHPEYTLVGSLIGEIVVLILIRIFYSRMITARI